jgi:TRAP-type transport system periplasmic protein
MLTRRQVNIGAVSAAALLSTGRLARAQTQTIVLKTAHWNPPNHPLHKAFLAWSDELEKLSNGRLKLQVYPSGQLGGGANRQFDSCRNGILDISGSLHAATPGRYSLTELAGMPFSSPSAGNASAIASKRLTELAPEFLAKEHEGLKILWMASTPPLKFHSKRPLRKVDDWKGIKVRYAGQQFKDLIDALDAVPLPVPPPETQDALAKGIVEAATFPYEGAASFGLDTIVKYSVEPGVASNSFGIMMNPAKYESLPADLKALIDKTTGPQAAEKFGKELDAAEIVGKEKFTSKGVEIITLPPEEVAKMKKLFAPQIEAAIAAVEKQGKPGRKFFETFTK